VRNVQIEQHKVISRAERVANRSRLDHGGALWRRCRSSRRVDRNGTPLPARRSGEPNHHDFVTCGTFKTVDTSTIWTLLPQIGRPTDYFSSNHLIQFATLTSHGVSRHPLWGSMFPRGYWIPLGTRNKVLMDSVHGICRRQTLCANGFRPSPPNARRDSRPPSQHSHRQTKSLIGARAPSSR
jgi:hypothetical protein